MKKLKLRIKRLIHSCDNQKVSDDEYDADNDDGDGADNNAENGDNDDDSNNAVNGDGIVMLMVSTMVILRVYSVYSVYYHVNVVRCPNGDESNLEG